MKTVESCWMRRRRLTTAVRRGDSTSMSYGCRSAAPIIVTNPSVYAGFSEVKLVRIYSTSLRLLCVVCSFDCV